jgi:hypothetical protein
MTKSARAMRTIVTAITSLFALLLFSGTSTAQTVQIFPENAPQGTHLQSGAIDCTETENGVSCAEFELAGVGNTDATVTLAVAYTATIQCTNNGGALVESHDHEVLDVTSATVTSAKNGRLSVPAQVSTAPTEAEVVESADCPNPNWTPSVQPGSVTVDSFTYTLVFEGFAADEPYVSITG